MRDNQECDFNLDTNNYRLILFKQYSYSLEYQQLEK